MSYRVLSLLAVAALLSLAPIAAFAGPVAVRVPEPAAAGMIAGAIAAVAMLRFRRRK